jgi:hypothetical protein
VEEIDRPLFGQKENRQLKHYDSRISGRLTPEKQHDSKAVISATCTYNNQRRRSVDRVSGSMIKRNFNFMREIKVIPYNISTIEHLLTKKCLVEVADKGIQADGPSMKAVEYHQSDR